MKRNNIFTIALIGALALLSASCEKEITNDPLHLAGTPIVFAASSTYDNGVETKAEYSGDLIGTSSKTERIDWKTNDPIKIIYNNNAGSYKVSSNGTAENEKSRASVTVVENGLTWGTGSSHKFYALYPNNSNGSLNGAVVTGTIPAAQSVDPNNTITKNGVTKYQPNTKQYGFMFGYLNLQYPAATVELPFKPAFTTLEFKLKRKTTEGDKLIKTIEVTTADETSGTNLTGTFQFTIPEDLNLPAQNQITVSNTGKTITLDFSGFTGGGVSVPTDNYLDFSVLALPKNQKYVKVKLTYTDNTVKKLPLKDNSGNWYEFIGGKKYIITNENVPGGDIWDYYIDEIKDVTKYGHQAITDPTAFTYKVYSYKIKRGTTTKVPVPWHMEYSTDDGANWSSTFPSTSPFTSANLATSGAGSNGTTYQGGYSTLPTQSTGSTSGDASDATRAALASADPRGTSSNYFDLSMHPCYGNKDATTSQNTANCYIVSAPGYYKFPLVYGNAIKNGADNVISYAPESVTHIYRDHKTDADLVYQANFHNAVNKDITGPYILTDLAHYGTVSDLDAAIIWQDVPTGYEIIPYGNPTIVGSGSSAYIQFSITAEDIQQGNIVIALRGKVSGVSGFSSSDKEILWSWHIWVTEKDLAPVTVNHAVNGTSEMAQYNLGWTDKTNAQSTKYPDRKLMFRAVQDEGPGKSEAFTFKQIGDATYTPDNIGSNAFYQWGRKDPFLTAASANQNKPCSTGEGYTITSDNIHLVQKALDSDGDPDFGYGIRHPYEMIKNSWSTGWVGGSGHVGTSYTDAQRQNSSIAYNLWSAYMRGQHDKTNYGGAKAKTVYDPCPPGFEVPSKNAFMGFVGRTGDSEAPNDTSLPRKGTSGPDGFYFYRNGSSGATIYLPYCGARGYNLTEIYDVKNTGYYWTDAPDKSTYPGPGGGSDHTGWRMSKLLYFESGGSINAHYDLYKGAAYAIRPVLESVQRVNTEVTTGGMDGNIYDFNDGWTIN